MKSFYLKLFIFIIVFRLSMEFSCITCGASFTTEKSLQRHICAQHLEIKHLCSYCQKAFHYVGDKTKHEKNCSGNRHRLIRCMCVSSAIKRSKENATLTYIHKPNIWASSTHVKNVESVLNILGIATNTFKHVVSKRRSIIVHIVQKYFLLLVVSIITRVLTKRRHQNKPQPGKGK